MKKFMRLFITMLSSFIIILGLTTPVLGYDQGAAQRYADQYVLGYNSNYRYFINGDCANFVSQCLKAGGLSTNPNWYYDNFFTYSNSWSVADSLKNYLKIRQGAEYIGRWRYTAGYNSGGAYYYSYVGVNNSANIQGLGSEVIFYDWEDDGTIDHAAIVVGTNYAYKGNQGETASYDYGKGYGDLIDQHTINRRHQMWHLNQFNQRRTTTAIYAFRVKT